MCSMRIGGLASGLDINQIVKDLMRVERMPLQKLEQEKQILEWKRDDYRAFNTLLLDFRTELTQMKLTHQYRVRNTTSTNEAFVTATATGAAGISSYSISKVSQLAAAETQKNGGSISREGFSASSGLYEQMEAGLFQFNGVDVWRNGFVQSKQAVTAERTASLALDLASVKSGTLEDWSVTVNGVGYEMVDVESAAELQEGQAWYDGTTLHFGNEIDKNSTVRVNYVAERRTERLSISHDTEKRNLTFKGISPDATMKLIINDKEEELEVEFQEGVALIRRQGGEEAIAELDLVSGEMKLLDGFPRPAEKSDDRISLEVDYHSSQAVYTTMSMRTHTANGEMYGSFLIDGRDSLNSVISRVNSSKLGVTMFYDDVTRQITMTRTETGNFHATGNEIEFSMDDRNSFLRDVLRFRRATVTEEGRDAVFTINGLETSRKSNTFEINGVHFTLKQIFDSHTDASTSPVSIHVHNDSEQVFENIKSFVDKYNELIDKIREKTEEERFRSYQPLTDEEREQLTDKQQEQWEEKAKSGLLRRDPLLQSLLSEMRMEFSRPVANDDVAAIYNQMAKLGITTTTNYLEGGKLVLNEAQLKKAIEDDPQSVENFFRGDGVDDSQRGVIHRLYDTVNHTMDLLRERAGNAFSVNHQFTIGREILDIDDRIERFEDKLMKVEDRYWRQFTAMEKAIQQANQQMAYLWQQFGGM